MPLFVVRARLFPTRSNTKPARARRTQASREDTLMEIGFLWDVCSCRLQHTMQGKAFDF